MTDMSAYKRASGKRASFRASSGSASPRATWRWPLDGGCSRSAAYCQDPLDYETIALPDRLVGPRPGKWAPRSSPLRLGSSEASRGTRVVGFRFGPLGAATRREFSTFYCGEIDGPSNLSKCWVPTCVQYVQARRCTARWCSSFFVVFLRAWRGAWLWCTVRCMVGIVQ